MIWRLFIPIGAKLKRFYPSLDKYIVQAKIKSRSEEIIAKALFISLTSSILLFILFMIISKDLITSLIISAIIFISFYLYRLNIPKLLANRKKRDVENKLMFAVDHMVIKLKSGVPLFDTMKSVARANYGELSNEFANLVKKIESGKSEAEALKEMASTSPSLYLRKIAWQIASSLKSGGDVANVLESISNELIKEREIKLKSYIGSLNVYLLLYMVISIIIPALFIIASLVISMLVSLQIPEYLYYSIPVLVGVLQFLFIGIIKSKRPAMWEE